MMAVLEKLIAAVEALTRHAPVGSASHGLIAEAKAHFEADNPPTDVPEEPAAPAEQQPEEHS